MVITLIFYLLIRISFNCMQKHDKKLTKNLISYLYLVDTAFFNQLLIHAVYRGVYNWSEMIGCYRMSLTPSTKIINRQQRWNADVSFLTQCVSFLWLNSILIERQKKKKKKLCFLFVHHISLDNIFTTPINYTFL